MQITDVVLRIAEIEKIKDDYEYAHRDEDILRDDVLKAISEGVGDNPSELASAVLRTADIEFERWCT